MVQYDVIEEHNEAFKKIYEFSKLYKKSSLCLLHIDDHSDLGVPLLKKGLIDNVSSENLDILTYSQIRVGDYIIPLFYKEIINSVVWLSNENMETYQEFELVERKSYEDYISIDYKFVKPTGEGLKKIVVKETTEFNDLINGEVVLSIDLDYFGSDDLSGESINVEITREEYEDYINNKYSKLRTNLGSTVNVSKSNGKYYLNMIGAYEIKQIKNSYSLIDQKLNLVKKFLQKNQVQPCYIVICKSQITEFTDKKFSEYIFEKVKDMIKELY